MPRPFALPPPPWLEAVLPGGGAGLALLSLPLHR